MGFVETRLGSNLCAGCGRGLGSDGEEPSESV